MSSGQYTPLPLTIGSKYGIPKNRKESVPQKLRAVNTQENNAHRI